MVFEQIFGVGGRVALLNINRDTGNEVAVFGQPGADDADVLFKERLVAGIDVDDGRGLARGAGIAGFFDAVVVGVAR